ncbi:putative bifunctional diguanylate cyclase/phosphodiesterase [Mesorhizobium xinjiangense]|uniref:putative bifunctional diguanylate cyclase/phosphodiesterase n=1 Tax=Mesorhizobium xinjiangense TaxID=2678685 RepID=UPI0012EDE7E4|nr:EAL domain-containing protein [Mesorhizobium xinjiangense]
MFSRIVSCIAYEHDQTFVLVAVVVCVMGAATAVHIFRRACEVDNSHRLNWLLLSGLAVGSTIWTTHFVAMLGFNLVETVGYDIALTLASLAAGIVFSTGGLWLAASGERLATRVLGGMIVGLGAAAAHYVGMAGVDIPARIEWNPALVAASVAIGAALGGIAFGLDPKQRDFWGWRSVVLVAAICGTHFAAMAAATYIPLPMAEAGGPALSKELTAVIVLVVSLAVMGIAIYGVDARTQRDLLASYRHAALHDPLTGMPNRHALSTRLDIVLGAPNPQGCVIVIDLDRFKDINDVHGHAAGDAVLQEIAGRFTSTLRDNEFIARTGGDEFVALKWATDCERQATDFADRLLACVDRPVVYGGHALTTGASIGASLFPRQGSSPDDLVHNADQAMYRAKKSRQASVCFFDEALDGEHRKRKALAMQLRHAVERDELELYYQPQIDVASGATLGFEALLRWNHPEQGLLAANDFVPIAEDTGLIVPIGEWVLRTACRQAAYWEASCKVAVNVASAQFTQCDLARIVHEALIESGLSPARLEIELTEGSIIEDQQQTLHVLRQLKALGVSIAMDDFGTGYSSLAMLQHYPIDKIKIDRSFISAIASNIESLAIVKSTIMLAQHLRIPVLAEGVESDEHLEVLRTQGCNEAQGYLFGRPVPLHSLTMGQKAAVAARR